jgi:hypothetical protein
MAGILSGKSSLSKAPLAVKEAFAVLEKTALAEFGAAFDVVLHNMHDPPAYTQAKEHIATLFEMNVTQVPEFDVRPFVTKLLCSINKYPVQVEHDSHAYDANADLEEHALLREFLRALSVCICSYM